MLSDEHERTEQEATLLREENHLLRAQANSSFGKRPSRSMIPMDQNAEGNGAPDTPRQSCAESAADDQSLQLDRQLTTPVGWRRTVSSNNSVGARRTSFGELSPPEFVLKGWWKLSPKLQGGACHFGDSERPTADAELYALSMRSSNFAESVELKSVSQDGRDREVVSRCIIRSNCQPRLVWDIVGLLLITYDIIAIPLMVFELRATWFTIFMDWFTLVFWTGDMIQSFFLDYYEKGMRVRDRRRIVKRYLKTWFVVDVVVVVPDWLMSILDSGGAGDFVGLGRVLRAARAVRMLRLLRLLKLQRILNAVYDMIDSEYTFIVLDLCRLLTFILVLNHVIACGWFLIGDLSLKAGELNWLEHAGYSPAATASPTWQYTTSLHWSLTQFTPASMDVSARNVPERVFSIVVLFFALVAFGTIVGSVTGSMTALRNMKGDSVKQFWMLRRYLKQRKIGSDLKERIVKFLEHREEQKQNQVQEGSIKILTGLSQPLHKELTHEMYMPFLHKHPLLKYVSVEMHYMAFRICTEAVNSACYAYNDVVFYAGDEAENMYVIKKGPFIYEHLELHFLDRVPSRAWAAEAVLWTQWRHRGELKTNKPGDLLTVNPDAFAKVMSIHPRPWHFARNYGTIFVRELNLQQVTSDVHIFDFLQDPGNGYSNEVSDCDDWRLAASRQSSRANIGTDNTPVRDYSGMVPAGGREDHRCSSESSEGISI